MSVSSASHNSYLIACCKNIWKRNILGGGFVILRKATIIFVMYVCLTACLSVRLFVPMGKLCSQWRDFRKILYLINFRKSEGENSHLIKIWQAYGVLHMKIKIYFWSYITQVFLEWEIFKTKFAQNIKSHILSSRFFFFENRALSEIMWKHYVQPDRPQMTIRRMRIAYWITKAKNIPSQYNNIY